MHFMKKITHFPQKCIGCLACTSVAPELFEADEATGLSHLIEGEADGDQFSRTVDDKQVPELLSSVCPAAAIEIS
jgi:ferredoxin